MDGILKLVLDQSKDTTSSKQVIQRLFIQMCSERDFSAQEVCHSLMGLKLYSSSDRKFVNVYFKLHEDVWVPISDDNQKYKSFLQKYSERSPSLEKYCVWHTAKWYNFPGIKKYSKETIVQVYPKYKFKQESPESNEMFYQQQVMLYVPWRTLDSLKQNNECWNDIYDRNIDIIKENCNTKDFLSDIQPTEEDCEYYVPYNSVTMDEWMYVSQMGPKNILEKVELGKRQIDLQHDWHSNDCLYAGLLQG